MNVGRLRSDQQTRLKSAVSGGPGRAGWAARDCLSDTQTYSDDVCTEKE